MLFKDMDFNSSVQALLLLFMAALRQVISLKVTGFLHTYGKEVAIFTHPLTWFEAQAQCQEDGYLRMDHSLPNYRRTQVVAQTLRENDFPPNLTFWTGLFRPYQNEDKWFKLYKTQCKPISMGNVIDNTYCDQQCLTLTFVDYNGTTTAGSANCLDKLPYTCIASAADKSFILYHNYSFTNIPYPAVVDVSTNISYEDCQLHCVVQCIAFTYNHTSRSCSSVNISERGYYHIDYDIEPTNDMVTHGARNGSHGKIYTNTSTPAHAVNAFPVCDVTTPPPGYCPCQKTLSNTTELGVIVQELDVIVQELVQNLTVSKDSTSKTTRKYTSVYETRGSAVAAGVFGIITISCVCALVIISDIRLILKQLKRCWYNLQKLVKCMTAAFGKAI